VFIDKQKKNKFDAISSPHEAALISMGVIEKADRPAQEGLNCPSLFIGTFEKYRELKFIRRETSDNVTIYPRDMLKWSDLVAYKSVTGQEITMLEAEVIMGIDGIFESRED